MGASITPERAYSGRCPSQGLLGEARAFKAEFVRPITAGADKHATERARSVGAGRAAELRARFAPFFLRREKAQVLGRGGGCVQEGTLVRMT